MAINQIYYGNIELINLQNDTITAADVCNQKTFHLPDGTIAQGINTYDADTKDADAEASNILLNKTAYINGNKIIGTMPNNGSMTAGLSTKTATRVIPVGYTSGGTVSISTTEQNKLIADNIKSGVTILGVPGTFTSDATATSNDIITDKTAYINGTKITGTGLDYTTFDTYCIDSYNATVILEANSRDFTLPTPPSTCNFNGRPIRWISIHGNMGTLTTTSTSTQNTYICSVSYSHDYLLKISSNTKLIANGIRVGKTNSTTAAAHGPAFGMSYFNFINFDQFETGNAILRIDSSKTSNVFFKSGVNYYVMIGG